MLTSTLHFWSRAAILLSTDKPLYQPDQTLHVRALIVDDQRRAWAKQPVRLTVHDPDDTVVFSADGQTSHFGIASADWTIPSSQKLGNYRVSAEISGSADSRGLHGDQLVRISRYELPTFTVNVVSDKPFYLPGQNADLTVSASYIFGKPVVGELLFCFGGQCDIALNLDTVPIRHGQVQAVPLPPASI